MAARRSWRYPLILLALFVAYWIAMAIAPWYREDWLLENVLVFVTLPLLVWSARHYPLSNLAYTALFVFYMLHETGAHYTYAKVPYDAWFESLTGSTLNSMLGLERNHFDRLVHFLYGVLVMPAIVEWYAMTGKPKGVWRWVLPIALVVSTSVLFELIEWAAAGIFGGELGQAYLGTQGDVWDAHQDMLLASCGALIAVVLLAWRRHAHRDN